MREPPGRKHIHVRRPAEKEAYRRRVQIPIFRERERERERDSPAHATEHLHHTDQECPRLVEACRIDQHEHSAHIENRRAFHRRPSRDGTMSVRVGLAHPSRSLRDVEDHRHRRASQLIGEGGVAWWHAGRDICGPSNELEGPLVHVEGFETEGRSGLFRHGKRAYRGNATHRCATPMRSRSRSRSRGEVGICTHS